MSEVPRIYIPEVEIDIRDAMERLDLITEEIRKININPFQLVYCGVEGQPFAEDKELPLRTETYGYSYDEFWSLSEESDRFGTAHTQNPLEYGLGAAELPALIGYDENLLDEEPVLDLWTPKLGHTLEEAVRVILFFTN